MKLITFIIIIIISCLCPLFSESLPENNIIEIDDWEYKLGDSPINNSNDFVWISEQEDTLWKQCDNLFHIEDRKNEKYVWYRTRIPEGIWESPKILILARAIEYAEIYINKKQIYTFGEGESAEGDFASPGFWHILTVNESYYGNYLYIRVYSPHFSIGILGEIFIGSYKDLFENKILTDIYKIVLVFLYILIFIFSFGIFIIRKEKFEYLAFSVFIISMALLTLRLSASAQLFIPKFLQNWRLWSIAVFAGTPSFIAFLEYTLNKKYKKILKRIWQSILIYGITAQILDLTKIVHSFITITILMLLTVPITIYLYFIIINEAIKGDKTARIFFIGISIFGILLIIDYIRYFARIYLPHAPTSIGVFILILSMAVILMKKFSKTYTDLQDLNINLERKVEFRTKELKKINIKLKKNDQEKTDFFANLAHEIKTPLTLIINSLQSYIKKYGMKPELESANHNLDLILRDIINFFDMMKWEKGIEIYKHNKIINLSEFTKRKINLFKDSVSIHNIKISADISDKIPVKADPLALNRLFNNLLDNAFKYNKTGGRIEINLKRNEKEIILSVCDTGTGINNKEYSNIFLPYYRLSKASGNIKGLGLGLPMVKNIVDSLKGNIEVKQNHPEGICFIVKIPAYELSKTDYIETKSITNLTYSSKETDNDDNYIQNKDLPAILIVEDNHELIKLMRKELSSQFFVHTALNGKAAIEKLETIHSPEIIVSDVMMDRMDGFELLNKLKNNPVYKNIPFLFLTARNLQKERITAHEKGALDYIYKPFHIDELIAKIKSILEFQNLKKELAEKEKLAGLGILLSGISHEILNPLSGISGPLAVLKTKIGNTDKNVYKNINYIEESVERIESIVNNLKDLYRTDNLPLTELNIKPIIQKAWEETKYLTDKNILLSIIMDDEIKLKIHEFSFLQILINLFRNSIEAFEKTGTIKIRLEHQEKSKELIFEDNGIGIKNKEIINVFNPFYTSKPFTNMGMGLFIVKNLAERMNWDISLLSGINSGTKVIFTVR